ncbi:hypothetical protein GJ688_03535 [Heliobacillus mobilis]|uniref:Uncharacterized protein n=1 Tax=Heliobacterium mobile TaxID=28064 RepID=A0A6I3SGW3_HELMO|nr:hypothetical protein [Heliobacterium mobile]MTV48052.1 hypothetical protein [Heliobacterium mobile]
MKTIGIAGTAKNTGKTTTASALLREAYRRHRRIAITSIGYDGEEWDNITGLPKPRLPVQRGTIVATARKCLTVSSANIRILEDTFIRSALGSIVIGEVIDPGLVVIAGPNKSVEVGRVKKALTRYRPDLLMVDGALNRIAPMVEVDGLILATGAARIVDPQRLARETESIAHIFELPYRSPALFGDKGGVAWRRGEGWVSLPFSGTQLLTSEDGESLAKELIDFLPQEHVEGTIQMPPLVTTKAIRSLLTAVGTRLKQWPIYFRDAISLLLSDLPEETYFMLEQLKSLGLRPFVRKNVPLLMVTVNPFYPEYDPGSQTYQARFLQAGLLEGRIGRKIRIPVMDVKRKGARSLWRKTIGF